MERFASFWIETTGFWVFILKNLLIKRLIARIACCLATKNVYLATVMVHVAHLHGA
jgi:hypothetical protein